MSSAEAPTPAPEASTSKVPAPAPSPAAPAAAVNSSAPAPPTPTAAPTPVSAPPSAAAAAPSTAAPAATPAPAADAPAPAVAASAAPANPLDALSQAELRKKLDVVRRDLKGELEKKKRIDRDLATLEASIYAFEGSYLSDALLPASTSAGNANAQFGNIIKGYDSYLKAPATGSDRKRGRGVEEARDGDRMFSRSSATYQKALDLRNTDLVESASEEESSNGGGRKKRKH